MWNGGGITKRTDGKLNEFLVETFHNILKIQEESLKKGRFSDLSLNKMHVIEEIGKNGEITMSSLAQKLEITMGTLTVAVESLVKKKYVVRKKSEKDKRIVNLKLTEKGDEANLEHLKFHQEMIDRIKKDLKDEEIASFCKGAEVISTHFNELKEKVRGKNMRIVTDSTCDLDFKFLEKNGVEVVKLKYFFGEDEFVDGESMTSEEFYEKLKVSDVLPTTSQPSPDQFVEVFEKAVQDGEEVLGVFLSSELSGTFQSASIAKSMVDSDKIHIVDSKAVTGSLGALVLEAIKLKEQGKTAVEIKEKLEVLKEKRKLFAVVATLKYLQMGGRLSKTSAVVGSILNMKPIISVQEGKVEAVAKVRGEQNAYGKIVEFIKENPINYDYPVMIAHANSLEAIEKFKVYLTDNGVELKGAVEIKIGLVVGVHVGEGAVAISYQGK